MLSQTRILDLSRLLPGPYCTLLLADLGAEVIKVESPNYPDVARVTPPFIGDTSAVFTALNRNKRALALDYRKPRGKSLFLKLAQNADVVVESFRPGAVKRWGLDYETIKTTNPRVIYCSLSGYGQNGPLRDRAGHDANYLALAGLLGLNGDARPVLPPVQISDLASGMFAAIAILAALVEREQTGVGKYLDMAIFDSAVAWLAPLVGAQYFGERAGKTSEVSETLEVSSSLKRGALPLSGLNPCYNIYETRDGRFVTLAALEPHFWAGFCQAVGNEHWVARQFDPEARAELAALFKTKTRAEWQDFAAAHDVCLEPVLDFEEMLGLPHVHARNLVGENQLLTPFAPRASAPAPRFGEHTRAVLAEVGTGEQEMEELEGEGVIVSGR